MKSRLREDATLIQAQYMALDRIILAQQSQTESISRRAYTIPYFREERHVCVYECVPESLSQLT